MMTRVQRRKLTKNGIEQAAQAPPAERLRGRKLPQPRDEESDDEESEDEESDDEESDDVDEADPLVISFVEVGQGDCTAIRLPDGTNILIDCGREGIGRQGINRHIRHAPANLPAAARRNGFEFRESEAAYVARVRAGILGVIQQPHIDFLIITHGDADHHNRLAAVLDDIDVTTTYLSGRLDGPDEYENGHGANTRTWLRQHSNEIYELQWFHGNALQRSRRRDVKGPQNGWVWEDLPNGNAAAAQKLRICPQAADAEGCTVEILVASLTAGQVDLPDELRDDDEGKNRGSIVTLITVPDHAALICGDATEDTLQYIRQNFQQETQELHVLHMPHHGSANTSTHPGFYQNAQPHNAVFSCSYNRPRHHLPQYDNFDAVAVTTDAADEHEFSAWITPVNRANDANFPVVDPVTAFARRNQHLGNQRIDIMTGRSVWSIGTTGTRQFVIPPEDGDDDA